MLRFGNVCNVDHEKGKYRVQFSEDDITSYWLSPVHIVTRDAKPFAPLSIGEHVACLLDDHAEDGVILGAIYSEVDSPGGAEDKTFIDFLNNVSIEYDSSAGALNVKNGTCEVVVTSSKVTVKKGVESLGGILSDLIDQMAIELHPAPNTPPANAAAYLAIKTRLLQFLG